MDKQKITYINDQIDGLISDLESVLMEAEDDEDVTDIDDAIDSLKDAEHAFRSILNHE